MTESDWKREKAELVRNYIAMVEEARAQTDHAMSNVLLWQKRCYEAEDKLREFDRFKDKHDFMMDRRAQREVRLWHWAHEELNEEQKNRYFNIVANGTADVYEVPTYAQQYNSLKHEAERLKKEVAKLRTGDQAVHLEALESIQAIAEEEHHVRGDDSRLTEIRGIVRYALKEKPPEGGLEEGKV